MVMDLIELAGPTFDKRDMTAGEIAGCSDCPPKGYPTDKTRCLPCPRRAELEKASEVPSPKENKGVRA